MIDTRDPKYYQRIKLWENVSVEDWNDRKWQLSNLVTDAQTLSKVIAMTDEEKANVVESGEILPFSGFALLFVPHR